MSTINNLACSVCFNNMTLQNLCITSCSHKFCKECLDKWFDIGKSSCPLCRTSIHYFKYLDKDTRVVCITRHICRPPNNNPNILVVQRKLYQILIAGVGWAFLSSALNVYLSTSCEKFIFNY